MRVFENHNEIETALAMPPLATGAFRFARQFAPAGFRCGQCGVAKPFKLDTYSCGTGYACNDANELICYACCGVNDCADMRATGRGVLYLTVENKTSNGSPWLGGHVSNWPGTLKIKVQTIKRGRHNIARHRYDCWFTFEGAQWHGVTIGDNTQICRVKRTKS